ncbi:MAG TPA: beta-eliminating lyase-related protein [Longimicrobium sp.]|nr:beta-eliminating lyase-related protein [Longimicrobium sp.]
MTHDPAAVKRGCTRFLSYDPPQTPREILLTLAEEAQDGDLDDFGRGGPHERLEARLREVLGKEAAVFMAAGRVAQLAALKAWCQARGNDRVAMHPRCHMAEYEDRAYDLVYGLKAVPIGDPNRPTVLADLEALTDPVGVISLEIPLFSLGCVLPPWEELVAMSAWARERGIPIHADGARLWEIGPYYGRSYPEIASLFDSITVSFYKSLEAIAGGAVAGPATLIAAARTWQRRLGAAPFRMFPLVLSALHGLETRLHRVRDYYDRARRLAEALARVDGVIVSPNPPHATSMLVLLRGDPARLRDAALEVSARTGVWLMDFTQSSPLEGYARLPLTVAAGALEIGDDEAVEIVAELQRRISAQEC